MNLLALCAAGMMAGAEKAKVARDLIIRRGRRRSNPRRDIQARQRRWIARRNQDGVWRYDGRVTEGGGK